MKCKLPYVHGGKAHPCGQCLPCRFNTRRVWTHRIMLEATQHKENAFVTLTYDDANLPHGKNLNPHHTQLWLKRLRFLVAPHRIRFYLVGEYGDVTQRPHYHAAIFGLGPSADSAFRETWKLGHILVGDLTVHSAQYIAGYVTKKMTDKNDVRLEGRYPEFCRMSNRPGIGADAMHDVASAIMQFNLDTELTDVPSVLRHGSRQLPLGRFLRRKLRTLIGRHKNAPQSTILAQQEELRPLFEATLSAFQNSETKVSGALDVSFREALIESSVQEHRNFDARSKIYKKGKSL